LQQPTSDWLKSVFTAKELNNRQIIDGMHSLFCYVTHVTKREASPLIEHWMYLLLTGLLLLNIFKTRACSQYVIVVKFIKFSAARESNDCQTFDWMNSIQFKASLWAEHWTSNYKQMHQWDAAVMILPIEKI